eukprot:g1950.t1
MADFDLALFCTTTTCVLFLFPFLLLFYYRWTSPSSEIRTIAFLHPYCSSGGGGERVLWCAVKSIAENSPSSRIVIYTGDSVSISTLIDQVQTTFNIKLPVDINLSLVRLHWRCLLEAKMYPRFTMLGQSFGSILFGLEALLAVRPDVWIDTTGLAFTYPLARLCGCTVISYTHYPTISTDMLELVRTRQSSYNNLHANSFLFSKIKLIYYYIFAALYAVVGRCCNIVMVNSSWTDHHICQLWGTHPTKSILYPPCDTAHLQQFSLHENDRCSKSLSKKIDTLLSRHTDISNLSIIGKEIILSIGQFRPEKEHLLQLESLRLLLDANQKKYKNVVLVLLGSCRDAGDRSRVGKLKKKAKQLHLEENVIFAVNAPFALLKLLLQRASLGLHTMKNEHFGIGIVEMMAAGCVPIAHASGGPKSDIIVPCNHEEEPVGFLASTANEYSKMMSIGLERCKSKNEIGKMRERGRVQAQRFSQEKFETGFWERISSL